MKQNKNIYFILFFKQSILFLWDKYKQQIGALLNFNVFCLEEAIWVPQNS